MKVASVLACGKANKKLMDEKKEEQSNVDNNSPENTSDDPSVVQADPVMQKPESGPVPSGPHTNKTIVMVGVILVVVLILGGLYYYFSERPNHTANELSLLGGEQLTTNETMNNTDVVAVVNGEEVLYRDLVSNMNQLQQLAAQQGANAADPAVFAQIQAQALDQIVNTALLVQSAQANGFTVSETAVDEELNAIESQFSSEAEFSAALESQGLTVDELREGVGEQLLVEDYLNGDEGVISVSEVTDAEVESTYAQLAADQGNLPPLEEIREILKQQLLAQKQQQEISDLIQGLRADADIETLI